MSTSLPAYARRAFTVAKVVPDESARTRNERVLPTVGTVALAIGIPGVSERESDLAIDQRCAAILCRALDRSIRSKACCRARGWIGGKMPDAAAMVALERLNEDPPLTGTSEAETELPETTWYFTRAFGTLSTASC